MADGQVDKVRRAVMLSFPLTGGPAIVGGATGMYTRHDYAEAMAALDALAARLAAHEQLAEAAALLVHHASGVCTYGQVTQEHLTALRDALDRLDGPGT